MLCWDSDDENRVDPSFFKQVKAIKKNCKLMTETVSFEYLVAHMVLVLLKVHHQLTTSVIYSALQYVV